MKAEKAPVPNPARCLCCGGALRITRLSCADCGLGYEGDFHRPRLARLDAEQRRFAEQLILAGGNLRKMEERLGLSYPTVRSRLDKLIDSLQLELQRDESRKREILTAIEQGEVSANEGLRLLDALEGSAA
ncbi:DUF2089 domain-containing protein [Marinobacterium rhizophilum]|uniref:DUF2089 domain-containing protein n=1 Tax=Marinobacterium rhizophilum TaxID=420402 RepID=A0ABY5HGN4_9GAMM|nr:DUF2089 family protein [Marinobacterium rhizophilum]UTW11520.1 DUF2089 domain-containing protein [Marinobacterium rhizophilum]